MRGALKKIKAQNNPRVQWAHKKLAWLGAAAEAKGKAGVAEIAGTKKRAEAVSTDVTTRLDEIREFFNRRNFKCDLEAPFTEAGMVEWVKTIKKYESMKPAGLAMVDRIVRDHPQYAKDNRMRWARDTFRKDLPLALKTCLYLGSGDSRFFVRNLNKGSAIRSDISKAKRTLKNRKKAKRKKKSKPASMGTVNSLREGADAADLKLAFQRAYFGKVEAEDAKNAKEFRKVFKIAQKEAQKALNAVRMPKAVSSSKKLIAVAKRLLKKKGIPIGPRMVISYRKKKTTERKRSAEVQAVDWLVIRRWNETYEEFQVTQAQVVGGVQCMVTYGFKYNYVAPSDKTLRKWYMLHKGNCHPILKKNIFK